MFCKLVIKVLLLLLIASQSYFLHAEDSLRFSIANRNSPALPPYSWYNFCTNLQQGFNVELYSRLAHDLGLTAAFIESAYADTTTDMVAKSLSLLTERKADLTIVHPIYTENNTHFLLGKEPALSDNQVLILAPDQPAITDLKELENLSGVGISVESIQSQLKKTGVNVSLKKMATLEDAGNNLVAGTADYWITSKFVAHYLMEKPEYKNKLKLSNLKVGSFSYFYITASADKENATTLIKKIDDLLASYQQSGYIDFLKSSSVHSWIANRSCISAPKQ
jgi:ABC-type amino acid transport substrate-binding protein